jgi:hypothetical protein
VEETKLNGAMMLMPALNAQEINHGRPLRIVEPGCGDFISDLSAALGNAR